MLTLAFFYRKSGNFARNADILSVQNEVMGFQIGPKSMHDALNYILIFYFFLISFIFLLYEDKGISSSKPKVM